MNKKAQFSTVPRQILKFLDNYVKGRVTCAVPEPWNKSDIKYIERLRSFVKETTHFEHPDMSGKTYYSSWGELMKQQLVKGLKLPYSPMSIHTKLGGKDELELFAVCTERSVLDMHVEVASDGKQTLLNEAPSWGPIEINLFFTAKLDNNLNPWGEHDWIPFPFSIILSEDYFKINVQDPNRDKAEDMFHVAWTCSVAGDDPLYSMDGFFGDHYIAACWILLSVLTALDEGRAKVKVDTTRDSIGGVAAKLSKNKNKKKFYDIHRLTISHEVNEPFRESKGGTHASPRWHKRRGYWRTMKKSGKVVWVNSCEVGKKSNGMVYKDYEVAVDA
jgi:hypothetical protein